MGAVREEEEEEMKHTPGPFYAEDDLTIRVKEGNMSTQEEIINDLLEACEALLRESDHGQYKDASGIAQAQYKAQQAIQKAKGE